MGRPYENFGSWLPIGADVPIGPRAATRGRPYDNLGRFCL